MTAPTRFAVAPNFHLPGVPADRLLVAEGDGWRPPTGGDLAALVPDAVSATDLPGMVLLFALPRHLQSAFWTLLEGADSGGDFDAFAAEVAAFLAFKELPAPEKAVFTLVLHQPDGLIRLDPLRAVINAGETAVLLALPGVRLRLEPGEACRLPDGTTGELLPPQGDLPDLLLLVSRPEESGGPPTSPA